MDFLIRAFLLYLFLLLLIKIGGKRTLTHTTTFDFVLILIIAEATQQALLSEDFSVINAYILLATLMAFSYFLSKIKLRQKTFEKIIDGSPLVLVHNGNVLKQRIEFTRTNIDDILETARKKHGLERLDQIKYAILEKGGSISIIKK